MKISVFWTETNPGDRGDLCGPSRDSYAGFADDLVLVDGHADFADQRLAVLGEYGAFIATVRSKEWPKEFSWPLIGQQFQRGYEAATGDWVIHADLDFIFHQNDYERIRQAFKEHGDAPALSFWKYQFILPDRYNLKSRLVIAVNKGKYGDRIKFGSGGDLCQPSLDGKELKPDDVPEARIPFYNYEKILKTEAQIRDDVGRMARAWQRHFGEYYLGGPDDESAYQEWLQMTVGRFQKPQEHIPLSSHPKVMQDTIRGLRPDQWGHSGFGKLPYNDYAIQSLRAGLKGLVGAFNNEEDGDA